MLISNKKDLLIFPYTTICLVTIINSNILSCITNYILQIQFNSARVLDKINVIPFC